MTPGRIALIVFDGTMLGFWLAGYPARSSVVTAMFTGIDVFLAGVIVKSICDLLRHGPWPWWK